MASQQLGGSWTAEAVRALLTSEDQRLITGSHERGQVCSDRRHDQRRHVDRAESRLRLGRADVEPAAAQLGQPSRYPDGPGVRVEITSPQSDQLTPPQPRERGSQDEGGEAGRVMKDPWGNEFCVLQTELPDLLARRLPQKSS